MYKLQVENADCEHPLKKGRSTKPNFHQLQHCNMIHLHKVDRKRNKLLNWSP